MTVAEAADSRSTTTVDQFLGGRVTLLQPAKGHRAGLDAALLQALVPADAVGRLVDLGTGVGTVALCAASRAPGIAVVGVERDASLVALANDALRQPGNADFAARVGFVEADATALDNGHPSLAERSADIVLMNPPWDTPGRVRASPDPGRRAAHLAEHDTLATWTRAAALLLAPSGWLGIIQRAQALPDILAVLAGRFGDLWILPTHPSAEAAATRILVRATLGSRAGIELRPGLVLHQPGGAWMPQVEAVLRGEASLPI